MTKRKVMTEAEARAAVRAAVRVGLGKRIKLTAPKQVVRLTPPRGGTVAPEVVAAALGAEGPRSGPAARSGPTVAEDERAARGQGRLTLRLPEAVLSDLERLASAWGMTRAGAVAELVRLHVKR